MLILILYATSDFNWITLVGHIWDLHLILSYNGDAYLNSFIWISYAWLATLPTFHKSPSLTLIIDTSYFQHHNYHITWKTSIASHKFLMKSEKSTIYIHEMIFLATLPCFLKPWDYFKIPPISTTYFIASSSIQLI